MSRSVEWCLVAPSLFWALTLSGLLFIWRPSFFWDITLCRRVFSNGLRSSGILSCDDWCLEWPSLFWHATSCRLVAAQHSRKTKSSATRQRKLWMSYGAYQTWLRRMTVNLLLSTRRLFGLEYEASTIQKFLTICQSTWSGIPTYMNFYQNCCETMKYRTILQGDSKRWTQLKSKRRLNTRRTVGCGIPSSLLAVRLDLRGLRSKLPWIRLTFSSDTRGRSELLPLHRQLICSNCWFQRQMLFLVGGWMLKLRRNARCTEVANSVLMNSRTQKILCCIVAILLSTDAAARLCNRRAL